MTVFKITERPKITVNEVSESPTFTAKINFAIHSIKELEGVVNKYEPKPAISEFLRSYMRV